MIFPQIDTIIPMLETYGNVIYAVVFFASFFEILLGIWFIFPGAVIVFLVSFFGVQNWLHPEMIAFMVFSGCMSGSMLDYYIGKRFWSMVWSGKKQIWKSQFFKSVRSSVNKSLFLSLVVGRFIPGVKEFAPSICGTSGVKFSTFLYYAALGNLLWTSIFFGIPYLFSYSISVSTQFVDVVSYFSLIVFIIFLWVALLQFIMLEYGKRSFALFFRSIKVFIHYILSLQTIKKLRKEYPKVETFLINRFKSDEFSWIPLTILLALWIYILLAFWWYVDDFLATPMSSALDENLTIFFLAIRNWLWVDIFLWITSLSKSVTILWFYCIVTAILFLYHKKNEIISLGFSIVWASSFVYALKIFFAVERPPYPVYIEHSYSFPSGHAMMSVLFYGFITWLLVNSTSVWKYKIWYVFYGLAIIALIGLSRLYLWVHYLSDVLGWYFIGSLWLLFCIGLAQYLNSKYKIKNKNPYNNAKLYSLIAIILGLFFFVIYYVQHPYVRTNLSTIEDTKNISSLWDIFTNENMKYTQTLIWENAENIHFIFLSQSDEELVAAFLESWWSEWDLYNYDSFKKTLGNIFLKTPYENAPITPLFWNNTTQQFAFQLLPDISNIRQRHHIRIWKTLKKYKGLNVYAWVWVYDIGLKWKIIHTIDPDINSERDYILKSLSDAGVVVEMNQIQLVDSYVAKNVFWDEFYSDWELYIVKLQQ